MDVAASLLDHPLFAGFAQEELERLCAASEVAAFRPGEAILRRGEPGRFLGLLLQGSAEVISLDNAGHEQRLAQLGPRDYFGEMSLISGEKTSAEVRAVTPCRVLLIPRDVFSLALATHPQALQDLARTVTQRLRSIMPGGRPAPATPEALAAVEAAGPTALRLLVIRSQDDGLRYSYYDLERELRDREGAVEGLGCAAACHTVRELRGKTVTEVEGTRRAALVAILSELTGPEGVLGSLADLTAIVHIIAHGGEQHGCPALIDDTLLQGLDHPPAGASLEAQANLEAVRLCRELAPDVTQVGVFQTAFLAAMPARAFLYALPYELYEQQGIRRHGDHGLAHQEAALLAADHLRRPLADLRLVTCFLGPDVSLCAVEQGCPLDATGSLGRLGGLPGLRRPGDLDPHVVLDLLRDRAPSAVEGLLSAESGLAALAGIPGDLDALVAAAREGNGRAAAALEVLVYAIRKTIGSYFTILGGLDGLVFCGAQGDTAAWLRSRVCLGLGVLGLRLDESLNQAPGLPASRLSTIADPLASEAQILVAAVDEHRMAAAEALAALGKGALASAFRARKRPIPVSISARHVHLSPEHVEALFGPGHELTFRAELSQPGQFACEENVALIGPRGRVERVRVLGPARNATQVEVSRTDEFRLGIDAPIRASGDLAGSPGTTLEGPAGAVELTEGVICAARHVHMSPEDALRFGLRDRDTIAVRVEGGRGISFRDVLVRVHPDFRLDMHVDTDEGNAAELDPEAVGYLEAVEAR